MNRICTTGMSGRSALTRMQAMQQPLRFTTFVRSFNGIWHQKNELLALIHQALKPYLTPIFTAINSVNRQRQGKIWHKPTPPASTSPGTCRTMKRIALSACLCVAGKPAARWPAWLERVGVLPHVPGGHLALRRLRGKRRHVELTRTGNAVTWRLEPVLLALP